MIAANTGTVYDHFTIGQVLPGEHRWIGRCKKCGATHQVLGELKHAYAAATAGHRAASDYVVKATDGGVWTVNGNMNIAVRCADHWCILRRVVEGTKRSKHECGARCTNATGPTCDCRCKGKNHGSNC